MVFVYILLLIISVFFYILYEGVISLMLLCFLVLLPTVLIICGLAAKSGIRAELALPLNSGSAGQNIPVNVNITNHSIIPVPCAEITLSYIISSSGSREKVKISTPIFPKNTQRLETTFSSAHLGSVVVKVEKIKIFDILRLTRMKLSKKQIACTNNEIMILPETLELANPVHDYSDSGLDSDVYSQDKPGDDPSEIFALREYADGDKLSRIHWKLTAKTDTLMVKDYSLPLADSCLLLADTYIPNDMPKGSDIYDTIIQMTVSLSALLNSNEIRHRVAGYSTVTEQLEELQVSDDNSMIASASMLLKCGTPDRGDLTVITLTSEEFGQARFGHAVLICASCSDAAAESLTTSGIAGRYTILVCTSDRDRVTLPDTECETYIVEHDSAEQCISELSL
ncbi:Uncharacterized conserved protein, DUF58 family, contains vWF domain [Ruminococcus sp. YE71]|uniref:DUF58 domain-containing protein n=1 Tax=unclassified Ruminococcus TaxID=2608920 RepID=UPI00088B14E6|nr:MULTISPECIES: DUF58 domain-containing protein [unclassified Ruminococcus]SDA17087.1 Uncharacterized conserved protein, DUF58 family, contains vWF domain [Ruminococcus sp. YE78]SFW26126.1 Uncharacterized conserved protein, DUF58 family, contains vWF domain [Ruminococcus sp. YE71]